MQARDRSQLRVTDWPSPCLAFPIMLVAGGSIEQPSSQSRTIAASASLVAHAAAALLAIWVSTWPQRVFAPPASERMNPPYDLVWLESPGPGGGGGGGGDRTKTAATAREIGNDRLTVPTKQSEPKPIEYLKEPPPVDTLSIPVQSLAAALESAPGVMEQAPAATTLKVQAQMEAPGLEQGQAREVDGAPVLAPASAGERGAARTVPVMACRAHNFCGK